MYYIFDSINFDTAVEIASTSCNIIFKNCTFHSLGIGILWAENITFENNKYLDGCETYGYGDSYIYGQCMNELTFINDQFIDSNELKKYGTSKFGIKIKEVKKFNIINSDIIAESKGEISVKAKETTIKNSKIESPEIYLESESINDDNCKLISSKGIIIENKNEDFTCLDVKSPIFIYNNENLSIMPLGKKELLQYRLIDRLRNLRDYCNQVVIDEKMTEIQKILDSENVGKILKK